MKRVKVMLLFVVTCLFAAALTVSAAEDAVTKAKKEKKEKQPKPKPVLEEVAVSGVIAKEEKKGKNDKVTVKYVLTDAEGNKIPLPMPKPPRKAGKKQGDQAAEVINLDDYLGAQVQVTGQGTIMQKKDKKIVRLRQITGIAKGGGVADIEVFPNADK